MSILDQIIDEMCGKRNNFYRNNLCEAVIRIYVSRSIAYDLINLDAFEHQHTGHNGGKKIHGYDVIIMESDGYHICVEHPNL